MKLSIPSFSSHGGGSQLRHRGFTLPEILIALTIFLFLVAAIMSAHLFGLRMFQLNNDKLRVAQWSRLTVETMTGQVHSCNNLQVGNFDTNNIFLGFLPGETNQGNCLRIQPTTNTADQIYYFLNPGDQTFRRTDESGNTMILANSITNALAFSVQDFSGNVLTNNGQMVHIVLDFYSPATYTSEAEFYKMETSIKQRVQLQ